MINVLLCGPISPKAVDKLHENGMNGTILPVITEKELISIIPDYDAIIVRSATKVNKKVIEAGRNLKLIVKAGSGYDNIDIEVAKEARIVVENCPDSITHAVVEFTFAQLLHFAKTIDINSYSMKSGRWEKAKHKGRELKNKTLGIIGFGRIGRGVAVIAKSFGMKVLVFQPSMNKQSAQKYNATKVEFNKLISESDYISLHIPLNEKTRNLISETEFRKMKPTAYIINNSREGIIDEPALSNALENKIIAGAAIDVWENETIQMDNSLLESDRVLPTSHIAGSTFESQENVGIDAALQIVDAFKNNNLVNVVNNVYEIRITND